MVMVQFEKNPYQGIASDVTKGHKSERLLAAGACPSRRSG
jgi:hypothetical protein